MGNFLCGMHLNLHLFTPRYVPTTPTLLLTCRFLIRQLFSLGDVGVRIVSGNVLNFNTFF